MMLGSCISVILSDRHASTSVISTTWLCGLESGEAAAVFSVSKLDDFLGRASWSRSEIDILEGADGAAIVK